MTHRPSGNPDREAADGALHLYGPAWRPVLADLEAELRRCGGAVVERFYRGIAALPRSSQFLGVLSADELANLKAQQLQNLLMLVAPDLTLERHRAVSLHVGRIHAIVGLPADEVILGQEVLHVAVRESLDTTVHGEALALLGRRLIRDLAWQIESYLTLKASRYETIQQITQLAWGANSYTDLIVEVAQTLGAHDEIAGCAFGRPDAQGKFRFESIAGPNTETYFAALERSVGGAITAMSTGPTGRAWRSEQIERCLNFSTDPRMMWWRPAAREAGFRSSVSVPLAEPGGRPLAVLILYGALPGGFASDDQVNFIAQLQTLLVSAIRRMESQDGLTHTVQFETRRHWAELLRSDALEMHYQPLVDLKSGCVTKVEALARLRDGDRLLTPAVFFPALSSDDFVALYAHGLRQALAQRAGWLRAGFDLGVSVNLPSGAFNDNRYFDITQRMLREYGCSADRLTLEVLETDEIASGAHVNQELARFKALGIRLAEDDLGSGHSSLTRLRELPFDVVKIDRSIVTLADDDSSDVLRFVYQLTRLGHSLGKQVIVEGVESYGLLEAIATLGVDAVQGYVIARPMPAADLERWIAQYRPFRLPDHVGALSPLVMLARLLLWEERLYLYFAEASVPGCSPSACTTLPLQAVNRLRPDAPCDRPRPGLPFQSVEPAVQQALVDAAAGHGMISAEYGAARDELVRVLTGRQSVVKQDDSVS
ncbi:EAL domain-containing protein [Paraburkholderia caballeronis]|uniref:EAL domain, c-di-GMP-specific phosphodiesterase class I (Or its enzymatically inactive variant) n=1 Tax=Paraburkholderia caballeronis TaxID=416943 RepID=A0A1H7FU91_9BURK|nr:EAL domain-containing protein [Paraburkholderia caballeronis]PXW24837.1 EAL domain-containing protein (putative c-di-GMP-specific phosphodiesterase class I) [Paraburkholderia caballeronis]PXX00567.1 EAL domain-containing protein (putative c-di-GMP-specific phosphodiesterase class I) [Paraburkholderia caballeronis]RAJ98630.1 EAL domain-containing protein (putative c-di-GMP-specific phosphodiesterase class I) [Paraburkholderia caballeronis]SEE68588.1 EAL domain, c-di-GMP-specific phosphodieste